MSSFVRVPLDVARFALDAGLAPTRWVLRRTGLLGGTGSEDQVVRTPTPDRPVAPAARATPSRDDSGGVADTQAPAPMAAPVGPPSTPPGPDHSHVDVEVEEVGSFGPADDVGATITVAEPFDGYDALAARDVVDRLRTADPALRAAIALYEATRKKRATVLNAARG